MSETLLPPLYRGQIRETEAPVSAQATPPAKDDPSGIQFDALLKQHAMEKGNRVSLPIDSTFSSHAHGADIQGRSLGLTEFRREEKNHLLLEEARRDPSRLSSWRDGKIVPDATPHPSKPPRAVTEAREQRQSQALIKKYIPSHRVDFHSGQEIHSNQRPALTIPWDQRLSSGDIRMMNGFMEPNKTLQMDSIT